MGRFERARVGAVHLATPARLLARRIRLYGRAATATRSQLGGERRARRAYRYMRPLAGQLIAIPTFLGALGTTVLGGTPARLPDIALQSAVLFHLERLLALGTASMALLLLVASAWRGQLPVEVSTQGIKYAPHDPDLERTVKDLVAAGEVAEAERALLRRRVDAIEERA